MFTTTADTIQIFALVFRIIAIEVSLLLEICVLIFLIRNQMATPPAPFVPAAST
jgi:hypothetical protein